MNRRAASRLELISGLGFSAKIRKSVAKLGGPVWIIKNWHLLKEENEHVEVHEIRGFASQNLTAALNEAHAISLATRCKQFLFSLSLNPPPNENVPIEAFEDAIERVEARLGLSGQPRAIVFHEEDRNDSKEPQNPKPGRSYDR